MYDLTRKATACLALTLLALLPACGGSSDDDGAGPMVPNVDEATFVAGIDNPYLPFPIGATWRYEAQGDEGVEVISIEVLDASDDKGDKVIEGVTATVVRDTVTLDGETIEDTWDWYAQDSEGNVWYLGEDTCEFEDGVCVDEVGAWEWGVDGALPGIVMPADPKVDGKPYYQEYYPGEAEDVGEVVEVGLTVEVQAGSFDDCVKTHDTSTLDTRMDEHKYYCRDIGSVKTEEPDITEELVESSLL